MNLESLFQSSKDKAWRSAAQKLNVCYKKKKFWHSSTLFFEHENRTCLLDTYTHQNTKNKRTRLRVPYVTDDNFRFNFYHASFLTSIDQFFGMQDIQIHDQLFNKKFILKGNDETQVKRLLADDYIRNNLMQMKDLNLTILDDDGIFSTDSPDNVFFIELTREGVIKDVEDIKTMFQLFARLLDRMVNIGAALHYHPNVSLK